VFDFFTGEDDLKLDPKGRVQLPQSLKRVIERGDRDWTEAAKTAGARPRLFVVYGLESWTRLECYSARTYQRLVKRISKLPGTDRFKEALLGEYVTRSFEVTVDDEGRFTIPLRHRERLKLDRDIYYSCKFDHFRLWTKAAYEAVDGARLAAMEAARDPGFSIDAYLPADSDEE